MQRLVGFVQQVFFYERKGDVLKRINRTYFSTRPALRSKVGSCVANAFHYSQGYSA